MNLKGTAYRFWPIDLEDERRFGSVYFKPIVVGLYGDTVEVCMWHLFVGLVPGRFCKRMGMNVVVKEWKVTPVNSCLAGKIS
jgi:hypothetical protein